MKRIAIYIDSQYNQGGAFQYTKSLIYAIGSMSSQDFTLTLLYTDRSWEDYLNSYSGAECIHLRKSHLLNKLYQISISIGFLKIVKFFARKFDQEIRYINDQNFEFIIFPVGDAIACLVNSNVVGTIHDLMHRYEKRFKESGGFFRYRFRENYYKRLLISSKAVLVDSELGKKHAMESYRKINARIYILPYIAPDYIYTQNIDKGIINSETFKDYIFYPAQFWPHKNHLNLLRALRILRDRGKKIDLLLSGSKNREYSTLKRFTDENDLNKQVHFLGYIPESKIVFLYRNALALVMPTFFGPTNIPPIEAILLGCPPLVSNIYGMPDQFKDAAVYFDPNDPEEIADRIESILNREFRDDLIKKGKFISEKFSQVRFGNDLKKILNELFNLNSSV